jgi:hypothetical protein
MSDSKNAAPAKEAAPAPAPAKPPRADRDRWNLKPVRRGYQRGHIRNLRRREELCPYGALLIWEFELETDKSAPLLPVRLSGTEFSSRLLEGMLVDVPDPEPRQLPLEPTRVDFSQKLDEGAHLIVYYPGRGLRSRKRDLLWSWVMMGLPVLIVLCLLLLIVYYFRVFG